MGCISSKSSAVDDSKEGLTKDLRSSSKRISTMKVSRLDKKRADGVLEKDDILDGIGMKVSLIDKEANNGSVCLYDDQSVKMEMEKPELNVKMEMEKPELNVKMEMEKPELNVKMEMEKPELNVKMEMEKPELGAVVVDCPPGVGRVPKALEGEQVAAGWPTWLSSVAGEAINGWIPRSANTFEKFDKIGEGTYSTVYKAHDLINQKVVALKRVRFDSLDHESVKFMTREIIFLRRLDHPNVIKLEGLITSQTSRSLYLVFEYMEHDLTGLVSAPYIKFSEPQIKCYMQQLLSGLDHCHSRGVLHRDIKGSNLLIDNNGILKIADFGLANFFDPHQSVKLTSRVVTLWYRPPELLLGSSNYGVAVDMWSTGCILGELYCRRPILPGKTEVEQLHKIFKLCGSPSVDYWRKLRLPHSAVFRPPHHYRNCLKDTFKEFPPAAVRLIETLLSLDPTLRGTAATALKNEFFSLEPRACDPSTLPKYPPSKEINTKMGEGSTKRQGALRGKEQRVGPRVRQEKESQSFVLSKADADSRISMQRGQHFPNMTSQNELFNLHREPVSRFVGSPHKQSEDAKEMVNYFSGPLYQRPSHSGLLVPGSGLHKVGNEAAEWLPHASNKVNLPKPSRTSLSGNQKENPALSRPRDTLQAHKYLGLSNGSESRRQHDKKHHSQIIDIIQTENGKDGHASSENKIYMSGPLLVSSNNMDQMLKEHERRIQEYSRRARIDRSKGESMITAKLG